ncbi:MAG: hypothetical protein KIT84_41255 [Labilithrix sp.]|nr:hypothetical protein [Labilithrix sp.]MCW5817499.1 hypothetical protein [Labilithrix sp.]
MTPLPLSGRGAGIFLALALLAACKLAKRDAAGDANGDASPFSAFSPLPSASVAAVVDAGPSPAQVAHEAALKRASLQLTALNHLVKIKKSNSKETAGEGDAESICDAVKEARAKTSDAEVAAKLDESAELCAFDIPLLYANEALDHLVTATSQASVRLMCERSADEIARARAAKPGDPKVRAAEYRRANSRCK